MLHPHLKNAATAHRPHQPAKAASPEPQTRRAARCPECGEPFPPAQQRQLFCCADHKAAFHNRATVRGRMLTPLAMAERQTRGGSRGDIETGRAARRDAAFLIDKWTVEDREAGRMSMVDYIAQRRRKGFELP